MVTHFIVVFFSHFAMLFAKIEDTPPTIIEGPNRTKLEYCKDVVFTCKAESDYSTPVQYRWLWNGIDVVYEDGRIQQDEDGSLHLITKNEIDGGASFQGEYTCNATNGYSYAVATGTLLIPEQTFDPLSNNCSVQTIGTFPNQVNPDESDQIGISRIGVGEGVAILGGGIAILGITIFVALLWFCHNRFSRNKDRYVVPKLHELSPGASKCQDSPYEDINDCIFDIYEVIHDDDVPDDLGIYLTQSPEERHNREAEGKSNMNLSSELLSSIQNEVVRKGSEGNPYFELLCDALKDAQDPLSPDDDDHYLEPTAFDNFSVEVKAKIEAEPLSPNPSRRRSI